MEWEAFDSDEIEDIKFLSDISKFLIEYGRIMDRENPSRSMVKKRLQADNNTLTYFIDYDDIDTWSNSTLNTNCRFFRLWNHNYIRISLLRGVKIMIEISFSVHITNGFDGKEWRDEIWECILTLDNQRT